MIRRKLAAFTMMLIAGISAGYFLFEKTRIISGACFLIGAGIAVILMGAGGSTASPSGMISEKHPEEYAERNTKQRSERLTSDIVISFVVLLAGFMLFAFNYAAYESAPREGEQISIHGRILNAEDRGDYSRLTVRDELTGRRYIVNFRGMIYSDQHQNEENHNYDETNTAADSAIYYRDGIVPIHRYIGEVAELNGEVREIAEADNPGCFNYRIYMRSKGVSTSVKAGSVRIVESKQGVLMRIRRRLIEERERFLSYFNDEISGLMRGLIFGDKSEIDEDILREFNMNSSGHILAVSGLHIGFLHSLLRLLSGRRRTLPASLLVILMMIIYGEMTMWSSSTVRAVIVLSLSILSVNLHRRFDLLTSLAAAAFLILTVRPYMLFNTGFQLSFAAMGSIAFLSVYINAYLGKILGTAASVQVGTMPLIALSFHRVNALSVLINIPIIMLSSLLVPICMLLLFMSMLLTFIPDICISALSLMCRGLIAFNHAMTFDGGFSNLTGGAGSAATITIYIFICILTSEWMRVNIIRKNYRIIKRAAALLIIPVVMMHICLYNPFSHDEIVFVSVGQGDCTHIRCGSEDILIDGGGSDFINTGERVLMPYLLSQGAGDVDVALVTHLHKDHYLGISELSGIYPVTSVGIPSDYRTSYEKCHLSGNSHSYINKNEKSNNNDNRIDDCSGASNIYKYMVGEKSKHQYGNKSNDDYKVKRVNDSAYSSVNNLKSKSSDSGITNGFSTKQILYLDSNSGIQVADDIYIEILWPLAGETKPVSVDDPNEHNTVYMIHYRGARIMVTGDLLEEDELRMVNHYKGSDALKCDILKVAHHGSKSSSSEAFLDEASPDIAVIQVGRNNMYGHPHEQTLARLQERGISVYRTDLNGAVGIDIRHGHIGVNTMR